MTTRPGLPANQLFFMLSSFSQPLQQRQVVVLEGERHRLRDPVRIWLHVRIPVNRHLLRKKESIHASVSMGLLK